VVSRHHRQSFFAYLPDELIDTLSELCDLPALQWGRPATPGECAHPHLVVDEIIDQCCSFLAAARMGLEMNQWKHFRGSWHKGTTPFLRELLYAAYLLDDQYVPMPENTRDFLVHSRSEALALLAKRWIHSKSLNELKLLNDLVVSETVDNNTHGTRQKVLELLSRVPSDTWWNLNSFIEAVHEREPDFQRPGGNYDLWYIQDANTREVLSGFANWQRVDGLLLRHLITGPMHWLGFFDLASDSPDGTISAFRYSAWAIDLFNEHGPQGLSEEDQKIAINSQFTLRVPALAPRWVRYQIARFTDWLEISGDGSMREYRYQATPNSLKRAHSQGLKTSQLATLLERWCAEAPPVGFLKSLENWEQSGVQISMQPALLLRFQHPEALAALKQSSASGLILEELNEHTIRIHPTAEDAVISTLAQLGYLVQREP